MKPEWCNDELWSRAGRTLNEAGLLACSDDRIEPVARALLEAEQRGRREGMERCRSE